MKLFFLSAVIVGLLIGCLQTENSSSLDANFYGETDIEFAAVKTVIYENCSSCHLYHSMTVSEMVDLGLVVLGDAQGSSLYYRIKNSNGINGPKDMPLVGTINPAELSLIENWINGL